MILYSSTSFKEQEKENGVNYSIEFHPIQPPNPTMTDNADIHRYYYSPFGQIGLQQTKVSLPLIPNDFTTCETTDGDDHCVWFARALYLGRRRLKG